MTTPEKLTNEIREHIEAGKYRAAAAACDKLNASFPDYDYGWFMTSRVALIIKKPIPALHAIDKALEIAPERPEWMFQKLRCLGQAGYGREAHEMAVALAQLQFKTAETSSELAMMLSRLGMNEAAAEHYRRAIDLGSENPDDFLNLAAVYRALGNIDDALDALDGGLGLKPDDAGALYLRSTLRVQTEAHNNVDELEAALESASEGSDEAMRLHYAVAKELEDLERYPAAFAHLNKGSALMRSRLNYSNEKEIGTLRTVRQTFTKERFDEMTAGHVDAGPIFIVGMPRTGTVLVDQVLRSHPVVESAAARQVFAEVLTNECMQNGGNPPANISELVARAVNANFEDVGANYVRTAKPQGSGPGHFVDRSPMNVLYVGFIHQALPKARIVVVERQSMDTCFLAYKTLFEGAFPFSYDLDEIADFYNAYKEQIAHWQSVIPGAMHTVRYEDLVRDPKPVIEDLLEYCGLSFDPACLSYWKDDEVVVRGERQPSPREMAEASIGMWKHYENELAGLREKIGA